MHKQARSATQSETAPTPGAVLYYEVLAGFIRQRSHLNKWCRLHGVLHQNAKSCLIGSWDGPKARELRRRLIAAAGIDVA